MVVVATVIEPEIIVRTPEGLTETLVAFIAVSLAVMALPPVIV
jgi:hypothetical protein